METLGFSKRKKILFVWVLKLLVSLKRIYFDHMTALCELQTETFICIKEEVQHTLETAIKSNFVKLY